MEVLIQYLWKHKIFPLKPLQTVSGLPVEVIDSGLWNTNAGPDFFNAKLKIDGTLWVGNVEIHERSSDWYRHGHDSNRTYDSVVLHVASVVDCDICRSNGETIPQLILECPKEMHRHYEQLCCNEKLPACYSIVHSLNLLTVHSWLTSLQAERLDDRALLIERWLEGCDKNWGDAFFVSLSRNFGFGLNGEAFETWAKQLPFRALDKHRDQLYQIEALFFGQAGLLAEAEGDAYYLQLRKEYLYLQHKFELHLPMDGALWRFLRLRPGNFPFVRLAQLAYLYHTIDGLFSKVMEAETISQIRELLATKTSSYWEEHYIFGRSSQKSVKSLGRKSIDLIIINTIIPFLHAYGLHKGDEQMSYRAQSFLDELKAEDNYITRKWNQVGIKVQSAADSQALVQLEKAYCEPKKCLYCRFGYEYLKSTKE